MSARLLVDTDVIIDGLRGYPKAVDYFQSSEDILLVSVITVGELYAGLKGKQEQLILERFLQAFQIIPVDAAIAKMGGAFRCHYGKSHGTGLADAFIAATAICIGASLLTLNARHYPMIDALMLPYKKQSASGV